MPTSTALIIDFDGTVTMKDIGDEVCDRFAPPAWKDIDQDWVAGRLSLPEAQRRMWALARATRAEATDYARQIGQRRPGLSALLDHAESAAVPVWLASGGFDFYIDALLGEERRRFARAFCNRARFSDDARAGGAAGPIGVEFPHVELACQRCAVCKGKVCDLARGAATRLIFVGDGHSDRCVIGRADQIFAVRGHALEAACLAAGAAYTPFERFDEIIPALR